VLADDTREMALRWTYLRSAPPTEGP